MSEPRLSARGVTFTAGGHTLLRDTSLDLPARQVTALLGPNGAGKTTLVQVMALLQRPDSGQVLFDGAPVRDLLAARRRMAVVFQEPLLLDTTVEGNVGSGLAMRGVGGAERKTRVGDWLARLGIAHLARRSARTLSGGEAQRTSLARALVLEPEVLFLDEPFAALDAPTRQTLIDDLDRLLAGSGAATLFVTHDRTEALRLGDRIAVLMAGSVRQAGTPAEVFGAPADEEVAQFVGAETIVLGTVRELHDGVPVIEAAGHTIEGGSEASVGDEVLVCLRPEDVLLTPMHEGGVAMSARNHLPATVTRILPSGPFLRAELDAGFPLVALITKQAQEDLALDPARGCWRRSRPQRCT